MKQLAALAVSLAIAMLTGCATMSSGGERVVVFLKAKPGQEKILLDKTREWMVPVRKVEGLDHVDINVQTNDPATLVLYYHWRTPAHGEIYRKSDLFKRATGALDPYIAERRIIVTAHVE